MQQRADHGAAHGFIQKAGTYSKMKYFMIWLIGLYRKYISPLKRPCCRFTPSCSAYAIEAFQKRGFFIGFILTVWRILRCNPFSKGGYDPVPEKGLRNPKPTLKDIADAALELEDAGNGTDTSKEEIPDSE